MIEPVSDFFYICVLRSTAMFEEYQTRNERPDGEFTRGMIVYFGSGLFIIFVLLMLTVFAAKTRSRGHVGADLLSAFSVLIYFPYLLFGLAMIAYTKYKGKTSIKWWTILTLFAALPVFFSILA